MSPCVCPATEVKVALPFAYYYIGVPEKALEWFHQNQVWDWSGRYWDYESC